MNPTNSTLRKRNLRKKNRRARSAFTLIEVMMVVIIIGILLNIAAPSLVRAREASRAKACVKNLKSIESAKEQYLLETKSNTAPTAMSSLVGATSYIKATPVCPSTGTYALGLAGAVPTCTNGNNSTAITTDDHILQ